MTTFGNPYDNQYHASSVQSGKSKRAAEQNQKESRKQKKSKSKGGNVNKGNKHGGYSGGGNKKKSGRTNNSSGGGGGSGSGGGGGSAGVELAPGAWVITQIIFTAAAIGQLIVGIIHMITVFESIENLCTDSTFVDCVGDSLIWNIENPGNGDSVCPGFISGSTTTTTTPAFTNIYSLFALGYFGGGCDNADISSQMNAGFRRGAFTFQPDLFMDNWTPLIFGIIASCQCIAGLQSQWISGSPLKVLLFHIIMMLFACFGYAGQCGIVIGMFQACAGLIALILMFVRSGANPYPTFYLCF